MEQATNTIGVAAAAKNTGYVAAFIASTTYLGLSSETIIILTLVIALDILTGVIKAGIVYGPRSITSSRFTAGVLAKLLLILIPITLALGGKGVGIDLSILAQGSISVLILSQVYSVVGNIHALQTKSDKSEFDAVAFIMKQLRDLLERMMIADPNPPA